MNTDKLIAKLRKRYTVSEIPRCRVCGGKLKLVERDASGSKCDLYTCQTIDADGVIVDRSHYTQSLTYVSGTGDKDVIALCYIVSSGNVQSNLNLDNQPVTKEK